MQVFELASQHKKNDKQKCRTEGFIHAGKALSVISHNEVAAIEQAHFDIFGETIDDRRSRKASLKEAIARSKT
ncbi:hypothetical protein H4J50_03050 [Colwellia sp. 6M3]|uniref:hypothetical protein n=1 Tax=Colwellia sp. 6M3 TaxID=2759849 RepID=UPI0015F4E2F3|nr:hypothetical protein [Colwellia sp. 6M3]MBA6414982.1 hypothetical protein [Colwellia sp. 6M3]